MLADAVTSCVIMIDCYLLMKDECTNRLLIFVRSNRIIFSIYSTKVDTTDIHPII